MIRYFIITLLSAFAITSCGDSKPDKEVQVEKTVEAETNEPYSITGQAPGVYNGMRVYIRSLPNAIPQFVDTAIVLDNRFAFDKITNNAKDQMAFLELDGAKTRKIIFIEKQPTQLILYKDSLNRSIVKGGKDNLLLDSYYKRRDAYKNMVAAHRDSRAAFFRSQNSQKADSVVQRWMKDEISYTKENKELIRNNKDSKTSLLVLGDLINDKLLAPVEGRELYMTIDDSLKDSAIAKSIDNFLSTQEKTAIGAKAPPFEGKTPDGGNLRLKDAMGKYTLIDFWASWCKPCRMENPNVVKAYDKFHSKGFNVISISLDKSNQEQAWKNAIKQDNMTWQHVTKLMGFQDPAARMYGVNSIPSTFLIDENGVIVAKNLRGASLQSKLEELLGS